MKEESPYIRKIKDELLEPDFQYIHDLEMLRAIVRQSERTGNYGSIGSWVNERYLNLKEKYPEAVIAFKAELEEEKEIQRIRQETKRQETLEKHKQSPYLREKIEQLSESESEERERQLRELVRLRDMMIHSKKLGYGGQAMAYLKASLRDKYPEAYETFKKELEDF